MNAQSSNNASDNATLVAQLQAQLAILLAQQTPVAVPVAPKVKVKVSPAQSFDELAIGEPRAINHLPHQNAMTYKELQRYCSEHDLKANGKKGLLETRVGRHKSNTLTADDYKKASKAKKERKPKAAKRTALGLSYRATQRVVKYLKENMPSNMQPEDIRRNTGWDNVEHNLTEMLTTSWFASMKVADIKRMAQECVLTNEEFQAFVAEVGL